MSHRVKDLLDEAVAGIEPRSTDPLAAVVRRGRTARVRAAVTAGLAVATVLTVGTVAGTSLVEKETLRPAIGTATTAAPRPATRPDRPPVPRLEEGRIVAGDVSVPVPEGWRTAPIVSAPCGLSPKTVLFGEGGNPWGPSIYCATGEIEVQSTFDVFPFSFVLTGEDPLAPDAWQRTPFVPYRMITLESGAPVWFRTAADLGHRLVLPWSRVEVTVRGGPDAWRQVLDTIETGSWAPGALALPERAGYAGLTTATAADRAREIGTTDPAKIERALELLRGAAVVGEGGSCARADQPTVALEIGKPATVPYQSGETGSFLISLAEGCHEVVSEEGGRARLDDASFAELGGIFGVELP